MQDGRDLKLKEGINKRMEMEELWREQRRRTDRRLEKQEKKVVDSYREPSSSLMPVFRLFYHLVKKR